MKNENFCHLHTHCDLSVLDGLGTPEKYVKRAKEMGFKHLAITDHGSIDSFVKLQQAADKYGIHSIFGAELYIVPDKKIKEKGEKRAHITLLIKNETGFKNICLLLNRANVDGFYYRPRIDFNDLLELHEGLIVMTACVGGFLSLEEGEDFFFQLDEKIGEDLYLEVMPHLLEKQYEMNNLVLDIHEEFPDIQLVGSNDCHYIFEDDATAQEVLLAVNRKQKWKDPDRFKFDLKGLHLRSADEMIAEFEKQNILNRKQIVSAMRNTIVIAKKCNFRIEQQPITLPTVMENGSDYLERLCLDRLSVLFSNDVPQRYTDRFYREFNLLKKKKFINYFLIVHELIEWCRDNNILYGPPGRGSIGGSLIAFLMKITCVDPLKYNLLFERFLDENSDHIPDIDMDFEDIRRPEIKMHLQDKYGKNNIAGVSTFVKMKSKYCIRDVSRVFDIPLKDVNDFCEIIDDDIESAIKEDSTFANNYPEEIKIALKLEGNVRASGKHAAALIIAKDDLTKGVNSNLCNRKKELVVNWDKDDAEFMGLMKLDVLGLNTLTIINETRRLIKENYYIDLVLEEIGLDDKDVLKTIDGKNAAGLFQLSGFMARQVTKDLGVDSFDDIVAILALGRPGPFKSGMTEEYIKRKHGKTWRKTNEVYEEVLKETYGLIVFQEDVMFVIHKVAGLPFSTADKIRKIIGKKRDASEFKPYEKQFIEGCLKEETLSKKEAKKIWDGFIEWAQYGFNRAHAVEYGMIAYWTAWLKYHYPTEFICANLTYGKEDKKEEIVSEANALGLEVALPKIGISEVSKWVAKDKKLFVPFTEIKGIGEKKAVKMAVLKRPEKKVNEQFFNNKITTAIKKKDKRTQLEKIADEIGAWGELCPITAEAQKYFSFKISDKPEILYPNLCDTIDDMFPIDVEDILAGKVGYPHLIHETDWEDEGVGKCKECDLRNSCKVPIKPSKGKVNVAIINGSPGKTDNIKGVSLAGEADQILWEKLAKKGYPRSLFHVTNVCKCFTNYKTPSIAQIKKCTEKWLYNELDDIDCRIILALGSIPTKVFAEKNDGITKLNATTMWNDENQAWVCYCLQPSSIAMDPMNKKRFNHGLNNFIKTLQLFCIK